MTNRDLIKQAKILATRNDSQEFGELLSLVCKFKINNRCQVKSQHLEYDPTGETKLPAPSCNGCHTYIDRAFHGSVKSEEANMRIKLAILATYEAMMEWSK